MSENIFDTESFLETQFDDAIDTTFEPIPEGDYQAHIDDGDNAVNIRSSISTKTGEPWAVLDVNWIIEDDQLAEELGRSPLRVRQSIFLDLTEDGKGLAFGKGKNRQLGLLREAVGQNQPGKPWSPTMLLGQPAMITVTNRPNHDNPDIIYDEVRRVAPLV